MRLFIRAECKFIGQQKAAAVAAKKTAKVAEQERKRDDRKRKLPFDPEKVPSSLRAAWLGDYLTLTPKTTRRHVLASHKVAKLALQASAFVRDSAQQYHACLPERMLQFAQQTTCRDPEQLAHAFQCTQDLFEQVIQLQYGRILTFLCSTDRDAVLESAPDFRAQHLELLRSSKSRLNSALRCHLTETESNAVMALPATQRRIGRYQKHQMDENQVALALARFYRKGSDREKELQVEMQKWELQIRGDSSFCEQYIARSVDVDVSEVAATMWLTNYLFDAGGHRLWSEYSGNVEDRLNELVFRHGRKWRQAAAEALRALPPRYR